MLGPLSPSRGAYLVLNVPAVLLRAGHGEALLVLGRALCIAQLVDKLVQLRLVLHTALDIGLVRNDARLQSARVDAEPETSRGGRGEEEEEGGTGGKRSGWRK